MAQGPEPKNSKYVSHPMVAVLSLQYEDGTPGKTDAALISKACQAKGFPCHCMEANAHTVVDWPSEVLKASRKHVRGRKVKPCDMLIVVLCGKIDSDGTQHLTMAQPMEDPDDSTDLAEVEYTVCKSSDDWPLFDMYVENTLGSSLDRFRELPRLYFVCAYEDKASSIKADEERLEKLRMTTREVAFTRGGAADLAKKDSKFNCLANRDGALILAQSANAQKDKPSAFASLLVERLAAGLEDELTIEEFLNDLEQSSAEQDGALAVKQLGCRLLKEYIMQDPSNQA